VGAEQLLAHHGAEMWPNLETIRFHFSERSRFFLPSVPQMTAYEGVEQLSGALYERTWWSSTILTFRTNAQAIQQTPFLKPTGDGVRWI